MTIDANSRTDRAAWLAERRNGIGASDVAAILNLSPWTSRYSLWADKVGLLPDEDVPSEAMEFGTRAEPMLAEWFAERSGLEVRGEQMQCVHQDFPWMRCSLDGLVFDGAGDSIDDALGLVEFKTTSATADEWAASVPDHYVCQATWASIVTGLDHVFFGVLHLAFGRPAFRTYEFTPAPDDKRLLIAEATKFWQDHIVTGVPPETDGSDATLQALAAMYPGDLDLDSVEASADLAVARDRIVSNKARIKACEQIIADEENRIRVALGDSTVLTHGTDAKGKPVVLATWKPGNRAGFDKSAALKAHGDLLAPFITSTSTRTLLVKPPKGN